MQTHLEAFSFCVPFSFSLSLWLWLLLSWPLQSGANTETWIKHCFSIQLQRPAASEAQMICLSEILFAKIAHTKVSRVALQCTAFTVFALFCFCFFLMRTAFYKFLSARVEQYWTLCFGNNNGRKIVLSVESPSAPPSFCEKLLLTKTIAN